MSHQIPASPPDTHSNAQPDSPQDSPIINGQNAIAQRNEPLPNLPRIPRHFAFTADTPLPDNCDWILARIRSLDPYIARSDGMIYWERDQRREEDRWIRAWRLSFLYNDRLYRMVYVYIVVVGHGDSHFRSSL